MKTSKLLLPLALLLLLAVPASATGWWVSGNLNLTTPVVASVNTGSCGSESCTSPDTICSNTRGEVTATCTAGQTVIVAFSATLASAPTCTCTPANAAADVITLGEMFCRASTAALTITWPTGVTAGASSYHCFQ